MPLYEEFDRYYAETQRGQKIKLHDPGETIQSKLPVADGELVLTQTRLYLAVGERGAEVPNVRLERSRPRVLPEDEYLEFAPRMGAFLSPGQNGAQFLQMVEHWRNLALDRVRTAAHASRDGIRRRYDAVLGRAAAQRRDGGRRQMKQTLRGLHAAAPDRPDAAARLGDAYLEEGNLRTAAIWLARARVFDTRFDRALAGVERPALPSREWPPPEWWIDRHLTPLLELPSDDGPDDEQRQRIRAARRRIREFREASGRAPVAGVAAFIAALLGWGVLLVLAPWPTLGATAAAAILIGTISMLRARGRRLPKR